MSPHRQPYDLSPLSPDPSRSEGQEKSDPTTSTEIYRMTTDQIHELMHREIASKSNEVRPVDTAPPSLDDDMDDTEGPWITTLDRWGDRQVPKPHF